MLKLTTLGGLALEDATGKPLHVQRRRLAMLVRLSAAGPRGMTREKLSASLWGESSQERARHALEQSVYSLRRQLGPETFIGSDPLHLNPQVISSDVQAFDRAITAGASEEAAALYAGDFLDGVFIEEAEDFADWAESERSRLRLAYVATVERIARESEARGDHTAATRWWRAHTAADPLSEAAVAGLVRSLALSGDSSGALQIAQQFEQRIALELQGTPGPTISELVRDIRSGSIRPTIPRALPVTEQAPVDDGPTEPAAAPAHRGGTHRGPTDPVSTPRRTIWRTAAMLGAGLSVALLAVAAWRNLDRGGCARSSLAGTPDRIAVLPPRLIGSDSTIARFAESVTDLLAIAFDGDGVPAATDPSSTLSAWKRARSAARGSDSTDAACATARAVGAGVALLVDAARDGTGNVKVTARILTASDGVVSARAEFYGSSASPLATARELLPALLARQAGEHAQRLASLSAIPKPALVEFLSGRSERRRGHVEAALEHFGSALALDSTFALAALEFVSTSGFLLRWTARGSDAVAQTIGLGFWSVAPRTARDDERWNSAMRVAVRERDRLNRRDRALLNALTGPRYPAASHAREMLQAWDEVLRVDPDRADANYSLGYLLLFHGEAMGLADARERAKAAFNRALEVDSASVGPLVGLLEVASFARKVDEARRIGALYLERDSLGGQADYVRWRVASLSGDERALARLRSRFKTVAPSTLALIEKTSQVDGVAVDDADSAAWAGLERAPERSARQVALHSAFFLALNRGRPGAALDILDRKRGVDPDGHLRQAFRLRGALFGDGDQTVGEASARFFADCLRRLPSTTPANDSRCGPNAMFMVVLWRLWKEDDTTGAAAAIEKMRQSAKPDALNPQTELLTALYSGVIHRSDAARSLARLDSLAQLGCCETPRFINFVVARLHERSGNLPAALAAVRRGRWLFPPEYLSTYLREEGRLADLTGDRDGARRAYHHYLALRASPEPSRLAQRDSVKAALADLDRGR